MIVFDASAVVSAALKIDGVPERALLWAYRNDVFAQSVAVEAEISGVLSRPKIGGAIPPERRARILGVIQTHAAWFTPALRVTGCRDAKDDKYLELALAAKASVIVSGDTDLLILDPWRGVRILRPADYLAAACLSP